MSGLKGDLALFSGSCDFVAGAANPGQLPAETLPEIAFAGRSNVGKSSLINAVVNRKNLARASKTPGRTQQINFFNLGGKLMLADLPGYGHASVPAQTKAEWEALIAAYLQARRSLQGAFLLVDSRHGIKDNDREMMAFLDRAGLPWRVALTKCDKISEGEAGDLLRAVRGELVQHPAAYPEALAVSAAEKTGIDGLRRAILEMAVGKSSG